MAQHPADTFTEKHELPLGICEELFATFFNHTSFKEWHGRHGSWQLRVIGPPGSGKTTLSVLIAQYLRDYPQRKHAVIGVATIFVKTRVASEDHDFQRRFLASVLKQLSAKSSKFERPLSEMSLEDLEEALKSTISSLERSFLIVDDVDACGRTLGIVKTELQHLQEFGLKVLVTSRIPLNYETVGFECDSFPPHESVHVYWICRKCYVQNDPYDRYKGLFVVCHECRADGKPCPACGEHEHLHEPYPSVDLNLPALVGEDPLIFREFLASELELTHGDIGLGTKFHKPPNSALGKEIRATAFDPNHDIIDRIAEAASYNISLAKVRLSGFQEAQTIAELVDRTKDRLPVNLVVLFEAGIKRILQQPESERMLGLVALIQVSEEDEKIPFQELNDHLVERGLLEWEPDQSLEDNLSRVLHASCGFIKLELMSDLWVEPFHHGFGQFIRDNYNEDLAQARLYGRVSTDSNGRGLENVMV